MTDPTNPITEAERKELHDFLELLTFVPPSDWVVEVPFSPNGLMREGRTTYGGKPMEWLLPSRREYEFSVRLQMGLETMPGHDAAASS